MKVGTTFQNVLWGSRKRELKAGVTYALDIDTGIIKIVAWRIQRERMSVMQAILLSLKSLRVCAAAKILFALVDFNPEVSL